MKRLFSIVFSVVACSTWAADDKATNDKSALEAARRDLRALPALEKEIPSSSGRRGFDASLVPTPTWQAPAPAPSAPPSTVSPRSDTWLVDAFNATETKESREARHLGATGQNAGRGAPNRDPLGQMFGKTEEPRENPLASYLQQWLSPQSLTLLKAERREDEASGLALLEDALPKQRVGPTAAPAGELSALDLSPMDGGPATQSARNPYLDAMNSTTASAPPSAANGSLIVPAGGVGVPTLSTPNNSRSSAPSVQKPPTAFPAKRPPAYTPPTAPIVDDQKYFPQLRRF